jgi:hypothetical protein
LAKTRDVEGPVYVLNVPKKAPSPEASEAKRALYIASGSWKEIVVFSAM